MRFARLSPTHASYPKREWQYLRLTVGGGVHCLYLHYFVWHNRFGVVSSDDRTTPLPAAIQRQWLRATSAPLRGSIYNSVGAGTMSSHERRLARYRATYHTKYGTNAPVQEETGSLLSVSTLPPRDGFGSPRGVELQETYASETQRMASSRRPSTSSFSSVNQGNSSSDDLNATRASRARATLSVQGSSRSWFSFGGHKRTERLPLTHDYHSQVLAALTETEVVEKEALHAFSAPCAACHCLGKKRMSCRTKAAIGVITTTIILVLLGVLTFYIVAPAYVRDRLSATKLVFTSLNMTNPVWPTSMSGTGNEVDTGAGIYGFTIVAQAVLSGLSPVDGTLHGRCTS